jgi:beta-glucanase (GH16 family)
MDLAEEVGYQPNVEYGVVHTVSDLQNPSQEGAFNTVTVPNNNSQYNTYTLLWTPTSITFEVNNNPFFTYNKPSNSDYTTWAFDQPFYMVADLALGGIWGGQDTAAFPGNGIDNSALPVTMSIKTIYYYAYNSN